MYIQFEFKENERSQTKLKEKKKKRFFFNMVEWNKFQHNINCKPSHIGSIVIIHLTSI